MGGDAARGSGGGVVSRRAEECGRVVSARREERKGTYDAWGRGRGRMALAGFVGLMMGLVLFMVRPVRLRLLWLLLGRVGHRLLVCRVLL